MRPDHGMRRCVWTYTHAPTRGSLSGGGVVVLYVPHNKSPPGQCGVGGGWVEKIKGRRRRATRTQKERILPSFSLTLSLSLFLFFPLRGTHTFENPILHGLMIINQRWKKVSLARLRPSAGSVLSLFTRIPRTHNVLRIHDGGSGDNNIIGEGCF